MTHLDKRGEKRLAYNKKLKTLGELQILKATFSQVKADLAAVNKFNSPKEGSGDTPPMVSQLQHAHQVVQYGEVLSRAG